VLLDSPLPRRFRLPGAASPLGAHERAILLAVADTALPGGEVFPRAGAWSASKLEGFVATLPGAVRAAFRATLWAIELYTLARRRRSFTRLGAVDRADLLSAWSRGDAARRVALRALLTPLKIAHFNDPAVYAELGCEFRGEQTQSRPLPRGVTRATEHAGETLECDVVVVGTGAGGAVAAAELQALGLQVLLLEEGELVPREEMTGHSIALQRKLYRDLGATFAVGNTALMIPLGRAVGGSTTINSGTCFRAPDRVLAAWAREGLADLAPDRLAPFYQRVESILEVAPARDEHLGGIARVIARGADRLGWRHGPLHRNAPDCEGKGVCIFGCPSGAKRSTDVSYVPRALAAGARLVTGAKVSALIIERGRAVGVRTDGFSVRARAVVLACGALLTPVLLERTGLARASGQLGRNLSLHPAAGAAALFDEPVRGWDAIPQGYAIYEFLEQGLLFEGAFMPPDLGAAALPFFGKRLVEVIERYDRFACFGFLIEDHSRGRVRAGPGGRPIVTYLLGDSDVGKLKRGVDLLARCYFAAGATSVFPMVAGFDELRSEKDLERFRAATVRARDFDITAYHPLGTCRMGVDPKRSVLSPDHEVYGTPGLFVTDGSAVPSSLGVNPQVTIMALATRAAGRIAAKLDVM
jgi:glycine/D-amino acid oxidase-like deaminating enzyme